MAEADRIAAALRYQQELDAAQRPATMNPNIAAQGLKSRNRIAAALASQPQSWSGEALPMEGRAAFLPFQDTMPDSVMNTRSLALPGIVAGAVNAITAPGRALVDPEFNQGEEAANVALNVMGGGMGASRAAPAPAGSLGMNVAPKSIKELMPTEYKSAMSIEPPHNVRDNKKLLSLTESMKNTGWQGRPILTYDVGRGNEALTGSHRIKAAREANIEVPIYEIKNVGNYVDANGKSIHDVGFMELNEQVKWLNKFGDKNAAKLLKQEPEF